MNIAERIAAEPAEFRRRIRIECNGVPRLLDSVLDDWQRRDFEALDGGWQLAVGRPVTHHVYSRAYQERGRGSSKTSDVAMQATWGIYSAPRPVLGVAVAASKAQARILRDAIDTIVRLNPQLADRDEKGQPRCLEVQNDLVINRKTGSRLQILASDADTLYGLLPDFVVCDELTHWGPSGEAVWEAQFSAAAKKSTCMLMIISNAGSGVDASWQWRVREMAKTLDSWYFSRLEGPVASWLSPEFLEEQRLGLTDLAYQRLWLNEWTEGVGDAVTAEMIREATTLDGPIVRLKDVHNDWLFLAGADLGVKNDYSAVVTVGLPYGSDQIVLADCEVWKPSPGEEVDLTDVARYIEGLKRRFRLHSLWFDPSQALLLAQWLRRGGLRCEEMSFSSASRRAEMATALISSLTNNQLQLFEHVQLIRDLLRLRIEERACAIRLVPPANTGGAGHCDAAIALSIVLPEAQRLASTRAYRERTAPSCVGTAFEPERFGVSFDPGFRA